MSLKLIKTYFNTIWAYKRARQGHLNHNEIVHMRENKIAMQKFLKSKTKIIEVFYLHKVIISIEHIN